MSEHDLEDRNFFIESVYNDKSLLIDLAMKSFRISFDNAEDLFDSYIVDFIEKGKIDKYDSSLNLFCWNRSVFLNYCKSEFIKSNRRNKNLVEYSDSLAEDVLFNKYSFRMKKNYSIANNEDLIEAMDMLDKKYRDTLILRYMEDVPVKEIANMENRKEATIRWRSEEGIKFLRTNLNMYNRSA